MMEHLQAGDINLDQVNDEDIYDIPPWNCHLQLLI